MVTEEIRIRTHSICSSMIYTWVSLIRTMIFVSNLSFFHFDLVSVC